MVASSLIRPVPLSPQPAVARRQLARLLDEGGWHGDADAVVLAVHEAMVNAQRHAGGVTGATASVDRGAVVVEVRDRGPGFGLPDSPELPDPAAETGRGLFLICRLAARVDVTRSDGEACLLLRFEC
jgi:anti-sigma regulatory factor (Ser/Thr protein kinase)